MDEENTRSGKKAESAQRSKRSGSLSENQIKAILIVFGVVIFDLNPKDACKKFDVPQRSYTLMCRRIVSIIDKNKCEK